MAQGHADVVQALQHTALAFRVNVEIEREPSLGSNDLRRQVDCKFTAGGGLDFRDQLIHRGTWQYGGQQAIFLGVAVEYIRETGGDDTTDAVVGEGPGRVLAAGAASEVLLRDQNGGSPISGLIQDEVRIGLGWVAIEIAPVIEKVLAEARAGDTFQKNFGDDRIGVDIRSVEGDGDTLVHCEWFHGRSRIMFLYVSVWPALSTIPRFPHRGCRRSGRQWRPRRPWPD